MRALRVTVPPYKWLFGESAEAEEDDPDQEEEKGEEEENADHKSNAGESGQGKSQADSLKAE